MIKKEVVAFFVLLLFFVDDGEAANRRSDIGKSDWTVKGIGRVLQYARQKNRAIEDHDIVFVGTEAGVVASLQISTGQILWRVVHVESEAVSFIEAGKDLLAVGTINIEREDEDYTTHFKNFTRFKISRRLTTLRLYDKKKGNLLWESRSQCACTGMCFMDWDIKFVSLNDRKFRKEGVVVIHENIISLLGLTVATTSRPPSVTTLWTTDAATISLNKRADSIVEEPTNLVLHRVLSSSPLVVLGSVPQDISQIKNSLASVPIEWVLLKLDGKTGMLKEGFLIDLSQSQSSQLKLPRLLDLWNFSGQNVGRYRIHMTENMRVVMYSVDDHELKSIDLSNEMGQLETGIKKDAAWSRLHKLRQSKGVLHTYSLIPHIQNKLAIIQDLKHIDNSEKQIFMSSLEHWKVDVPQGSHYIIITNGWDTFVYNSDLDHEIASLNGLWCGDVVDLMTYEDINKKNSTSSSLILTQIVATGHLNINYIQNSKLLRLGTLDSELLSHRRGISSFVAIPQSKLKLQFLLGTGDMSVIAVSLEVPNESKKSLVAEIQWIREESITSIKIVKSYSLPKNDKDTIISSILPSAFFTQLFNPFNFVNSFLQKSMSSLLKVSSSFPMYFSKTKQPYPKPRILAPIVWPGVTSIDLLAGATTTTTTGGSMQDKEKLSHKIWICSTAAGKVMAIHAKTGDILWVFSALQQQYSGEDADFLHEVAPAFPRRTRSDSIVEENHHRGVGHVNGRYIVKGISTTLPDAWTEYGGRKLPALPPIGTPKIELLETTSTTTEEFRDELGELDSILFVHLDGVITFISPRTGQILKSPISLRRQNIQHIVKIKSAAADGGDVLVFVGEDKNVFCMSLKEKTQCKLPSLQHALRHYLLYDVKGDTVCGYKFDFETSRLLEEWIIQFQTGSVVGLAPTSTESEDAMVPVHVRGDSSILHKLASSNLVAIVTSHAKLVKPTLVLHIVDSYFGRVLYSQKLPQHSGLPLHLLMKEHRVITHFWNSLTLRHEMSSLELYYNQPDKDASIHSGPLGLLMSNFLSNFSVFDELAVHDALIFQHNFILKGSVRAMTFSSTKKGLTPQSLIVATGSGQICAIPHRLFTPRRPVITGKQQKSHKTPEELEEGLPPYTPMLPLIPTEILSYDQIIYGINGIASIGTELESASLILAYGLDMFSTLLRPAMAFDAVGDSFNHIFLTTILVVAVTVVFIARKVAVEKGLTAQWK